MKLISGHELRKLLTVPKGRHEFILSLSFDLGLSKREVPVCREDDALKIAKWRIEIERIRKAVKKPEMVFFFPSLEPVEMRSEHYYRLVQPFPNTAPTLEIDGIHMHRTVIDPLEDSRRKVELLKIKPGEKVLDICTGLGYTAILEKRFGATVLTVEKDRNVLEMAKINPWSKELWEGIEIVVGDAVEVLPALEGPFDKILHDPPRFALAPELYSTSFYTTLRALLRPGGILYHYVGFPGEKKGFDLAGRVISRLKEAGFRKVRRAYWGVLALT